jgi:hypothetical protein
MHFIYKIVESESVNGRFLEIDQSKTRIACGSHVC